MEERIREIIENVKSGVEITNDCKLITDKIIDSIDMMELITELEDAFGIEISMEYMDHDHFDTIDAIVKMVEELS